MAVGRFAFMGYAEASLCQTSIIRTSENAKGITINSEQVSHIHLSATASFRESLPAGQRGEAHRDHAEAQDAQLLSQTTEGRKLRQQRPEPCAVAFLVVQAILTHFAYRIGIARVLLSTGQPFVQTQEGGFTAVFPSLVLREPSKYRFR